MYQAPISNDSPSLSGQELLSRGFQHVDALDICEGMLEVAAKKNIYKQMFNVGLYPTPTPG